MSAAKNIKELDNFSDDDESIDENENNSRDGDESESDDEGFKKIEEDDDDEEKDEEASVVDSDEESEDDDEYIKNRLRKVSKSMKTNVVQDFHPELKYRSADEIDMLSRVIRDKQGKIVDPIHQSLPILTKYERARILGERARQLDQGAQPFVKVSADIIDSYIIAQLELKEKAMPFILERPMPNGGCEYWRLVDLEYV